MLRLYVGIVFVIYGIILFSSKGLIFLAGYKQAENRFNKKRVSKYNSRLFDAVKRVGSQAIFAGHDHVNDWAAKYDGVLLVYNQCGGYSCYTMYDYDNYRYKWDEKDWRQGYTVTNVKKDGSIELRQSFNAKYL